MNSFELKTYHADWVLEKLQQAGRATGVGNPQQFYHR